jgi:hypothetical protein
LEYLPHRKEKKESQKAKKNELTITLKDRRERGQMQGGKEHTHIHNFINIFRI